jgi:hypothetical protein
VRDTAQGADGKERKTMINIDKQKLLGISKDLKRNVLRNTKEPLDLLD